MTREEIALFLDLDESFTSGQLEECFSRKLAEIRQELAQAGSKPARAIARTRLERFEKRSDEIASFVNSARALEEASTQLAKAEECIKSGRARLASVPLGRLREIKRELLPAQIQDRIDEIGVILEEEAHKAELAAREADRIAREAEEKARREEAAEQAKIEAEKRARQAEEEARLAEQRAAGKAAGKAAEEAALAERKAAEETARKEAEALATEEAEKKARAEAEERARFEELERLAREKEAVRLASEKQQALASATEAVRANWTEAKARVTELASRGDYEAAAAVLIKNFNGPDSPAEREVWESVPHDELVEAATQFAAARLADAHSAQKAGYLTAAAALADVVLTIAPFLPGMAELEAACDSLKLRPVTQPKATPCSSLTIEYRRGDAGKRRLHILSNLSATFGRSVNSDVVVRVMASMNDAEQINRLIGRCHFMVENAGRFVNIIDGARGENGTIKASTNGVFIDGRRLVYPRSIEGRGETLHIASQQLASHVAHWTLKLVGGETEPLPDAVRQLCPEGKWPQVSGLFMARQDEMPEDVLFVWEAVPLSIVDAGLARYWLVRSGDGFLVWDGASVRDLPTSGLFPVLSTGRLAHIGG
jgi:hypothetical protein